MKNIIIMGAPGSGKGTQSERVLQATNYIHISSGDFIRQNVKAKTPLGLKCLEYINRGELVPDDLIIAVLEEFVKNNTKNNVVWDGFPRTSAQAEALDQMLKRCGAFINKVFLLDIDEKKLLNRVAGRLTCNNCGRTYNAIKILPKVANICDHCGFTLSSRSDDTAALYKVRLNAYHQ